MRRMNYPRFDKPTYVGTFVESDNSFHLDETKGFFPSASHDPEPGIYFVLIKDQQDSYQYSCIFTIDTDLNTGTSWYSSILDDIGQIFYIPGDGPVIGVAPNAVVHVGSTIELYKLN